MHRLCLLFVLLMAGPEVLAMSSTYYLRSESTLHSDGSIERAIVQSVDVTPESARISAGWTQATYATSDAAISSKPISDLPVRGPEGNTYFAAWGHFASADDLAHHYEIPPRSELARAGLQGKLEPSTLERHYTRTDHVFAVEHRWEERLTSGTRLEDIMVAFDEWAAWSLALHRDVLEAGLRPEYDAAPYLEWYRSVVLRVLEKELLFLINFAVREAPGRWQKSEELEHALRELEAPIRQALREEAALEAEEKPGELLMLFWSSDDTVRSMTEAVQPKFFPRGDDGTVAAEAEKPLWKEDADGAIKALINEKYGGKEALSRQATAVNVRIFGAYRGLCIIFCDSYKFRFSMSMPGRIVETNGVLEAGNRVAWRFDDDAVSPLGYRMHARSLEPKLALQEALVGERFLETRKAMLDFVGTVGDDEALHGLLAASRDAGRLLPEAAFSLAERYEQNNSPEAWPWFCRGAAEGYASALYHLASRYRLDAPVPRGPDGARAVIHPDDRAAYVWYAVWARSGNRYAAVNKERIAETLSAGQLEEAQHMLGQWTPEKCPWPG